MNCPIDSTFDEMHLLAYVYHWGVHELWDIPKLERRKWVEQVLKQKEYEQREIENANSTNPSSYKESL